MVQRKVQRVMVISSSVIVCGTTALKYVLPGKALAVIRRSKRFVTGRERERESFHGAIVEAGERDLSTLPHTNTDKEERERLVVVLLLLLISIQ
jgi:hypothetical protein